MYVRKHSPAAERHFICCYIIIHPQRNISQLQHKTFSASGIILDCFTNRSSAADLLHIRQQTFPFSGTVSYLLFRIHSSTADLFLFVPQIDPLPRKCRLRSWWLSTHPTEFPRFGAKVEHGGTFFFALDMVTGAPKEPDSPLQMPYQTRIRQTTILPYKRRQTTSNKSSSSRWTKRRRQIVKWTV